MGNKEPDIHAMDVIMALSLEVLKGNPPSKKVFKVSKVVSIAANKAMKKYNLRIDELISVLLVNLVSAVSAAKFNGDTSRTVEYWKNLPGVVFGEEEEETTCH